MSIVHIHRPGESLIVLAEFYGFPIGTAHGSSTAVSPTEPTAQGRINTSTRPAPSGAVRRAVVVAMCFWSGACRASAPTRVVATSRPEVTGTPLAVDADTLGDRVSAFKQTDVSILDYLGKDPIVVAYDYQEAKDVPPEEVGCSTLEVARMDPDGINILWTGPCYSGVHDFALRDVVGVGWEQIVLRVGFVERWETTIDDYPDAASIETLVILDPRAGDAVMFTEQLTWEKLVDGFSGSLRYIRILPDHSLMVITQSWEGSEPCQLSAEGWAIAQPRETTMSYDAFGDEFADDGHYCEVEWEASRSAWHDGRSRWSSPTAVKVPPSPPIREFDLLRSRGED